MDKKLYILILEDEKTVLDAILRDMEPIEENFRIEIAQSVSEAKEILDDMSGKDFELALAICDHILPGENGIDFMIWLRESEQFSGVKKILLTGQASHEDTIEAINRAEIDFYFAKPWDVEKLQEKAIDLLSDYVIKNRENVMPFLGTLNPTKIAEAMRHQSLGDM